MGRAVVPEDLLRIRGVGDPQISPDGTRIAFVVTSASQDRDEYASNIWVVNTEGGEPRQITEGDFPCAWPAWSPDGTTIAFSSERHETRDDDWADDIYVVGADGRDLRRLTDSAGPMWYAMFAPDGQSVVYVGTGFPTGDGRNARFFSVRMDGGKPRALPRTWTTRSGR
jgi:Tol biopolymer transport system component